MPLQSVPEFLPCITTISKKVAQPRITKPDGLDEINGPVTILNGRTVNDDEQHAAKRVGDDMTLAALDFLTRIIATNPAAFGGFDTLAVNHTGAWACLAALKFTGTHNQQMVDRLPQTVVTPAYRVTINHKSYYVRSRMALT